MTKAIERLIIGGKAETVYLLALMYIEIHIKVFDNLKTTCIHQVNNLFNTFIKCLGWLLIWIPKCTYSGCIE